MANKPDLPLVLLLLLFASVILSGCDRPFVAPRVPSLTILSPDFNQVFDSPSATLSLQATSFRDIDRVFLNGELMEYDPTLDVWNDTLFFEKGLNQFILSVFDVDDVAQFDTVYAAFVEPAIPDQPVMLLPSPIGGHTSTLLDDGRIIVAGGAGSETTLATTDILEINAALNAVRLLELGLASPRVGHTASRLADGRILFIGGSRTDTPTAVSEFVETVEILNTETGEVTTVSVEAPDPIRRTHHTAFLYPDPSGTASDGFIYLFGGFGDVRFGSTPVLAEKRDLRVFHFKDGVLRSASPSIGFLYESISGHTQTLVSQSNNGLTARYIMAGASAATPGFPESKVLQFDITPTAIDDKRGVTLVQPRFRHSASLLSPEMILLAGGNTGSAAEALDTFELLILPAGAALPFASYIRLPEKRWGQTATNLADGRILIMGGFHESGNALASMYFVNW